MGSNPPTQYSIDKKFSAGAGSALLVLIDFVVFLLCGKKFRILFLAMRAGERQCCFVFAVFQAGVGAMLQRNRKINTPVAGIR
jgi:hypothetical protein